MKHEELGAAHHSSGSDYWQLFMLGIGVREDPVADMILIVA